MVEAVFQAVLEQQGLHSCQRHPVQMCQDQVYSLKSACTVSSELKESLDYCRHIVIILLHDLRAFLPHLFDLCL